MRKAFGLSCIRVPAFDFCGTRPSKAFGRNKLHFWWPPSTHEQPQKLGKLIIWQPNCLIISLSYFSTKSPWQLNLFILKYMYKCFTYSQKCMAHLLVTVLTIINKSRSIFTIPFCRCKTESYFYDLVVISPFLQAAQGRIHDPWASRLSGALNSDLLLPRFISAPKKAHSSAYFASRTSWV